MRRAQKLAAGIAAAMVAGAMGAPVSFAADNAFGIDEINWTQQDWNSIAMTNDDTVDTGAVIRTSADTDSEAAGYLYRGAAAHVVEKGEEWTEVRSGNVKGYVKNEFLAYGDDARGLAAHYGTKGIIANWDEVNVFAKDDADSEITVRLSDGTPMSMVEDNGHWITVQHGADSAGFVSEEDVTRVLLVDTAVPAQGEDLADVPAALTAADMPSGEAGASSAQAVEASAEAATSQAEETTDLSYAVTAYEDYSEAYDASYTDASSYTQDPSYTDASSYTEDSSYTDASSYTQDTAYTEPSYTDTSYADGASGSNESGYTDTQDYGAASGQVSDNADLQSLYEAYLTAQDAAMDCTSEEDAAAKAAAATAAWNTYLAACGESVPETVSSSETTAASSGSTDAETAYADYTDYSDSAQTAEYGESVQPETTAQTEASASSSGSAYGNYSDLDLLAAIIWCEAGNQSYDGMVAVGQVVMNRVASSSFPNTVSDVLNQPGQFTPASAGTLQAALASGVNSTCYAAASDAMGGASPVPGYPLYFNTHSGSYQLGAHYFS